MRVGIHGLPLAVACVVGLCGCGPDLQEEADCEGNGPTRLVELSGPPTELAWAWGHHDERGWVFFDGNDGLSGRNLAVECGKPPRVFARDIPNVFPFGGRGPWLGVAQLPNELADVFIVDPWGGTSPMQIPRRPLGQSDGHIFVAEDGTELALWRAALEDPFALEAISLDLQLAPDQRASWGFAGQDYTIDPLEMVFVEVREGEVHTSIGIDPHTGQTLFSEDGEHVVSKMGGRFVVLREHDGDATERYAVVDTRDPKRRVELPSDVWSWVSHPQRSDCAPFVRRTSGGEVVETTLVLLPELRTLQLEGNWSTPRVAGTPSDGRRILTTPDGFFVLEPNATTPQLVYEHVEGWGHIVDDTLYVQDRGWNHDGAPGDALVEVPLDGSPSTVVLEPPVLGTVRLTGDRWALQRHEQDGKADLHVFDRTTGREEVVLEGIDTDFERWNAPHWLRGENPPETDDIVYSTTTDERTTVWRFIPQTRR